MVWVLSVLSGFFIGTSYIPFPPWASLFAFVPLWLAWQQQNQLRNVLLTGWLTSIVFTLIGFNWVAYMLHEFAHLNWFLSVIGLLLYSAIAHLYVPVAGGLWFILKTRLALSPCASLFLLAIVTLLCEKYSITLFDWNFGYTWFAYGVPLVQLAEWIGFAGLSTLTLLFNLPIYMAWKYRREKLAKRIMIAVLVVFGGLNLTGVWLAQSVKPSDAKVSVMMVQGNIGNEEKVAAELGRGFRTQIIHRYLSLSRQGLEMNADKNIDFMLWPEAAFPSLLGENIHYSQHADMLKEFLKEHHIALISGGFSTDGNRQFIGNSLFVLDRKGDLLLPYYTKTILLAFGEYIPGEDIIPQLRNWLPAIGQFKRGSGPALLGRLNGYKMGAQICYESLFPEFSRQLAEQGAQFIVNVTNDSWYGSWQEPYQHFYMTLARAIEFRMPVLRVTNTGISSVALATGEIMQRSPIHKPWTGVYEIHYRRDSEVTFYQKCFYLIPFLLWGSFILLLLYGIWQKNKRQHEN